MPSSRISLIFVQFEILFFVYFSYQGHNICWFRGQRFIRCIWERTTGIKLNSVLRWSRSARARCNPNFPAKSTSQSSSLYVLNFQLPFPPVKLHDRHGANPILKRSNATFQWKNRQIPASISPLRYSLLITTMCNIFQYFPCYTNSNPQSPFLVLVETDENFFL